MFETGNENATVGSAPITLFKAMTSTSGNASHELFSNRTCTGCLNKERKNPPISVKDALGVKL